MYTKLDDIKLAHKVNKAIQSNPTITKKDLCKLVITNWHRLNYLEQQGLIRRDHEQRTSKDHTQI
jgi:hypothetical protein